MVTVGGQCWCRGARREGEVGWEDGRRGGEGLAQGDLREVVWRRGLDSAVLPARLPIFLTGCF